MAVTRTLDPQAKRAAIMAAGEALFASNGFAKTTMAQIAARADVAVGSLYRAFPDKLALLAALHEAMEQRFIDVILNSWDVNQPPAQQFRAMIAALMHQAVAVRSSMPLYMLTRDLVSSGGEAPGARIIAVIATLYAGGIARGEFVSAPPHTAAAIAHGMVEGGMRDLLGRYEQADCLYATIDILGDFFVRTFVAQPPPETLSANQ